MENETNKATPANVAQPSSTDAGRKDPDRFGKFRNLLITERDRQILLLLNGLGVANGRHLRFLLSPGTSLETFSTRLLGLERKGFLRSFREDHAPKGTPKIYALATGKGKLSEITQIIGRQSRNLRLGERHIHFNHTLAIVRLLCHTVGVLRSKNPGWVFDPSRFVSQWDILEKVRAAEAADPTKPAKHPLPDGFLIVGNGVIGLEAELSQTYTNWKAKVAQRADLSFYWDSPNYSPWLSPRTPADKKPQRVLFVSVPGRKADRYRELSKPLEGITRLHILPEEELVKA